MIQEGTPRWPLFALAFGIQSKQKTVLSEHRFNFGVDMLWDPLGLRWRWHVYRLVVVSHLPPKKS